MHIVLIMANLNNLDAKCANAQNAFLTDNLKESVLLWNGQEFGVHKRKVVVIVRALNGVMDARYAWELAPRKLIRDRGLNPCRSDRYVWMRMKIDT